MLGVAAPGNELGGSIEGGFSETFSITIIINDIISGITPIEAIYGMDSASTLMLPTKANPGRVIEQVSLFLADVSQGRAARTLGETRRPKARGLTTCSDSLHGVRLITSILERKMAHIKVTPITIN